MTSSSEDSTAPLDFRVSSSLSEHSKSDYLTEGCPLCFVPRRTFYCNDCICKGDFIHSSSVKSAERFSEKKQRLFKCKQESLKIEKSCEDKLSSRLEIINLVTKINVCKERIKLIKVILKEKRESVIKNRESSKRLIESNRERKTRLLCYEERIKKLENFVKSKFNEKTELEQALKVAQAKLKRLRQVSIKQLIDYIFPISVIKPFHSDDGGTISALAEASRTAYIRGKWVFTDISSELQHCIVAPTLPSSGDYSPYNDWVSANKDAVPGTSNDTVERNPAYTISAALTYTAQLVNLLGFYLDVRLPLKMNYSEFCGNEISEEKFARRVARLNWNIVYLCLSQNVKPELITPQNTLQNILVLLNLQTSDLGRIGASAVHPDSSLLLEESLRPALDAYTDSEDTDEDSDHLPNEWEAVPNISVPEMSIGGTNILSQQQISSSSVAGGLVSSAAASIASLWRGWTK